MTSFSVNTSFIEKNLLVEQTMINGGIMVNLTEQKCLLQRLQQANAEDNLTLFVGAGVSKTVPGSKAKLWSDLVKEMQDTLKTQETDPLYLAQMLSEQYPEKYNDITRNSIDSTGRISDIHKLIARLKPRTIITTNWDCLLEKALELSWYDTITCDEELLKSQRDRKLIKMHGDFARGDDRFVFKEDDYLNYSKNYPLIETFVKNAIATTNVLFIGYSYNDINFKMIMTWLKQNRKQKGQPLHVIAQYEQNDIQKKYFKNWGIETYLCDDTRCPEGASNLSDDEMHRSYRLYNFLHNIFLPDKDTVYDIVSIWEAYKLYKALHSIPFKLITDFLPSAKIACNRRGNPILTLCSTEDSFSQELFTKVQQYVDAKKLNEFQKLNDLPECIGNIIDFWMMAGISSLSINYFPSQQSSNIIVFDTTSASDNCYNSNGIEDYLSFKRTSFNKSYNEQEQAKIVTSLLKEEKLAECLIESAKLYIYHLLTLNTNDTSTDFCIMNVNEIVDVLPRYLQKKLKSLVDILTFIDIKDKSKSLYAKINEKYDLLNQRKNRRQCSFNNTDSLLEIKELQQYLSFFWENNLSVEYFSEIKEYVYLSLKYLFFLYYFNQLAGVMDHEKYEQSLIETPAIPLRRFELSALLHFADDKKLGELLDRNTYLLTGPVKLDISTKDMLWLIDVVLPNLIPRAKEPINLLDGTVWSQRIGYVFKLLAVVEKMDSLSLEKIFSFLLREELILKEPFTILHGVTVFFESRNTDLSLNPDSSEKFIISFLQTAVEYFNGHVPNPYTSDAFSKVCRIASCFTTYAKIPEKIVDAILRYYLSLDLRSKCHCIQCLCWIYNVINEDKKKEIGIKINTYLTNLDRDSENPVLYEIFKIYLVHLHISELTIDILKEISSNEELRPKPGSWNSDADWLLSLLMELVPQTVVPAMREQLNIAIQLLTPQEL